MLIAGATVTLDPGSIFQGETDEIFHKFNQCIDILENVMSSFEVIRNNLESYFKDDVQPVLWTFHPRSVFGRLMDFVERLKLVKSMLANSLEFIKLEKVEFGGIEGRVLSKKCAEVLEDFNSLYIQLGNITYDILDPEDFNIEKDYENFCTQCADFDRRLGAIFSQAFDECYTLESIFKLIAIMGVLVDRPLIGKEVLHKYSRILELFNEELDSVKVTFDQGVSEGIPIDEHYPPVVGALTWLFKLRERIRIPAEDFMILENEIVTSEDAIYMMNKFEEMTLILAEYGSGIFKRWVATVPGQITSSLNKFQLVRDPQTKLLAVNFDKELNAALREVK